MMLFVLGAAILAKTLKNPNPDNYKIEKDPSVNLLLEMKKSFIQQTKALTSSLILPLHLTMLLYGANATYHQGPLSI